MSYLMFWPTFSTDGSSSSGFSLAIAVVERDLAGAAACRRILVAAIAQKIERALRGAAGRAMASGR